MRKCAQVPRYFLCIENMVFRALIVLFSYGYNIKTCKIIEATFLTLHFLPYAKFFAGQRGAWSNGKYVSAF